MFLVLGAVLICFKALVVWLDISHVMNTIASIKMSMFLSFPTFYNLVLYNVKR